MRRASQSGLDLLRGILHSVACADLLRFMSVRADACVRTCVRTCVRGQACGCMCVRFSGWACWGWIGWCTYVVHPLHFKRSRSGSHSCVGQILFYLKSKVCLSCQ